MTPKNLITALIAVVAAALIGIFPSSAEAATYGTARCIVVDTHIQCSITSSVASGYMALSRPSGAIAAQQIASALSGTIIVTGFTPNTSCSTTRCPKGNLTFQTADPNDARASVTGLIW